MGGVSASGFAIPSGRGRLSDCVLAVHLRRDADVRRDRGGSDDLRERADAYPEFHRPGRAGGGEPEPEHRSEDGGPGSSGQGRHPGRSRRYQCRRSGRRAGDHGAPGVGDRERQLQHDADEPCRRRAVGLLGHVGGRGIRPRHRGFADPRRLGLDGLEFEAGEHANRRQGLRRRDSGRRG